MGQGHHEGEDGLLFEPGFQIQEILGSFEAKQGLAVFGNPAQVGRRGQGRGFFGADSQGRTVVKVTPEAAGGGSREDILPVLGPMPRGQADSVTLNSRKAFTDQELRTPRV